MPKYLWSELKIKNQRRYKGKGFKRKENTGIDTETYKGKCRLICDSFGEYAFINEFDDILRYLCSNRYRGKFNWFYNIKFDFEAIVKHLSQEDLLNLYLNGHLIYNDYHISYLDRKYFGIVDKNKNRYHFYDMFSFLDVSLNTASKTLLNDNKLDIIDSSQLNINKNYWKENKNSIVEYCIKDAVLTAKLANYFWEMIWNKLHYAPKRPFSKGRLSEEYFLHKFYIPTINDIPKDVLKYAYNSYSGGRFEILQRGFFPSLYSYDIKSAYPAEIANLADYSNGEWIKGNTIDYDADIGFYYCLVTCYEPLISPFVYKYRNVLNIYPNGRFKLYLTKKEIEFIESHFKNVEIEIISSWEFMIHHEKYPFREEIERLYEWKETEKDKNIKLVVKIILNSLYGKTIQTVNQKTGKLFNPIWAAIITSNTRLKLLDFCYPHYDKVIAFSTDSVKSTIPLKAPENPKLGEFDLDFKGRGIYIMSDIYTFWNDSKQKNKFRGFTLAVEKDYDSEEEISLIKILEDIKYSTEYTYNTKRVYHLGECLLHTHKRTLNDLNLFDVVSKKIQINGDKKRIWERMFINGNDVRNTCIKSKPILVI